MGAPFLTITDIVADPDAAFERARAQGAIVETDYGPLVVRHEALRAMLQDARMRPSFQLFLEQLGILSGPFYEWMCRSPLNMEGEEHRRWRSLVMRVFTPRSVERLRPFLRAEAERLIDSFIDRGKCEFVDDYARKLPSLGLCELIGVPKDDRDQFCRLADTIGLGFNLVLLPQRITDIDQALVELREYCAGLIAARRREPRDDFVTRLAQAADDVGGIGEDLINMTLAGLVFAGHETTKNQLGWMLFVLSGVPGEWDKIAGNPSLAREAVEEVLRFRSAATSVSRLATEPLELLGQPIAKGTHLIASLWSANRDPAAFRNPQAFDIAANREGVQVAFGQGAHHCLGAALARAELQESLLALTGRLECPRIEPGAEFLPPIGITGPVLLPITFVRRAG